jgi:phosphate transport system permease protein
MSDKIAKSLLTLIVLVVPAVFVIILVHLTRESWQAITQIGLSLFDTSGVWRPLSQTPSFSILPMVLGTLSVAFLAVCIAAPVGFLCAIFLNFYCGKFAKFILSFIDLLAGIPSVIYGFIGIVIVVRNFERIFNMAAGESVLAAALVLSVMLLPYIISGYSESLEKAKDEYNAASMALGVSPEYAVLKVIIPATKRSAAASVMAAFGRGMGETMAVMMVIGNAPVFPKLFGRAQTIPALTALEMGSAEYGSLHLSAIYAANLVTIILLSLILVATHLIRKKWVSPND